MEHPVLDGRNGRRQHGGYNYSSQRLTVEKTETDVEGNAPLAGIRGRLDAVDRDATAGAIVVAQRYF